MTLEGLAAAGVAMAAALTALEIALLRSAPLPGLVVDWRGAVRTIFVNGVLVAAVVVAVGTYLGGTVAFPLGLLVTVALARRTLIPELLLLRVMDRAVAAGQARRFDTLATRVLAWLVARPVVAACALVNFVVTWIVLARPEQAERIMEGVPRTSSHLARMLTPARWCLELNLAQWRLEAGRLGDATRALAACIGPPPLPELGDQHDLIGARIDAASGEPDRALAQARGRKGNEWKLVEAHARAAKGEVDKAEAILAKLADEDGGRDLLARVVKRGGPAAAAAARVLGDRAAPYR